MPEGGAALKVLLVEDDASIRRFVALALEDEDLRLVEAKSLAEARACLLRESFDVVIADLMLGDGSGMDLLRELAAQPALTRMAFSAGIDRTVRARLDDIGVTEVLSKPVSVGALQAAVARARATRGTTAGAAPGGSAAPAAGSAAPAAGPAAVAHYFGGDRSLFVLYRQQCLAQFTEDIRHGDACAADGRVAEMRHLAHSLKSVMSMLGDEVAGARARALEDVAAAGDAQAAAALWRALAARLRAHRDGAA